jgi:NADH-quinone oxidoreductase subunit F
MNFVLFNPANLVGADLDAWFSNGGGRGLRRALEQPGTIIDEIAAADLRGCGGAGFATHRKWQFVADAASGDGKYLIANGNEDEPGTYKDRMLLEHGPHQVIEGALIAALAARIDHIVLYINPHEADALAAARLAVDQWSSTDLLDGVAAEVGRPITLRVLESSGMYIGGEETAAIASVEGGFPFPRAKPPFPATAGVDGKPTLVNNIETLANVPHILANGPAWFHSLGIGVAAGTKLYSLSGDVLRPGVYELPMGTSLRTLVFDVGGGMLQDKRFKAVFTGGPSNTILSIDDLDVALDWESVAARNSRLGTGAMIVVSEGTSMIRRVAEFVDFFAAGSCGQCPSCSIGTQQMARLLRRIDTGTAGSEDVDHLESLCHVLPGSGKCGLVDGAVTVVRSSLDKYRIEYTNALKR